MKTQNRKSHLALALVAGALLLVTSPLLRGHDGKKGAESEHADMAKPSKSATALEQVHRLHASLVAQVKDKELKAVHETVEQLTEVLNSLPALSKDLPADKLKRVAGAVKNLAKVLDDLHDAADKGNQAGTEKHLGTVESLLKIVSAQYPMAKM